MLSQEQKTQFSELLEELGQTLDISESQYDTAVRSYQAVGNQLSKPESALAPYEPEIIPQGSFLLGTMIKPVNEKDDLDIDLVCQLTGKKQSWSQYDLKKEVGNQLKSSSTYGSMLDKEGRRCWTIVYADSSNYHMDILPAIVDTGVKIILEKAFSAGPVAQVREMAIRITDNERGDYYTESNHKLWLKSNPFGYSRWFYDRATINTHSNFLELRASSIKPVPKYQKQKLPLQRVIQILKRHRDLMFNGDEDKPISIIITTLAARAYNKETSIIEALQNIISQMPRFIEEKYNPTTDRMVKWISNPVNPEENFADKWEDHPKRQENFYKWLRAVQSDIDAATFQKDYGLHNVAEALKQPFGDSVITKALASYGEKQLLLRETGNLRMASGTGTLGTMGRTNIRQHTPYGSLSDE